ncbi:putative colanic acid biosynthesis UDP-glucose lipid carrier transferase [Oxalobacteraceae bacterium GrIS 1.18]
MIFPANELPLVYFFKRLLEPFIIVGILYLVTLVNQELFDGYYVVLVIVAFFVSSFVYEQIDPSRGWRAGGLVFYVRDVFAGWAIVVFILFFIGYATALSYLFNIKVIYEWFAITPFALLSVQLMIRKITLDMRKEGEVRSAIIIGTTESSLRMATQIEAHPNLLVGLNGHFEDREAARVPEGMPTQLLGKIDEVPAYVREHNIQMVFISLPMSAQPRIHKIIDELKDSTASVYFLPDIYTFDLMQARFDHIGGVPVVAICETPFTGINSLVKRASDIILAAIIQLLLLPVMVAIAIAIKMTSKGPIIFRQRRYGLYGEQIVVYKFRSMTVAEDGDKVVQAKKNDQRVTKLGNFLRKTSLDELPQFINVLQGRMSIVGPRPHAVAHNEQYRKLIKGYMLRHKVRPGITGWAQVNGLRGETDTIDKMQGRIEYDLFYLRNWSLSFDLWIILCTIRTVLRRDNAH